MVNVDDEEAHLFLHLKNRKQKKDVEEEKKAKIKFFSDAAKIVSQMT